jgi:hypothetical protein
LLLVWLRRTGRLLKRERRRFGQRTNKRGGQRTFGQWEKRFDRPYLWMLAAMIVLVTAAIAGNLLGR